MVDVVEPGPRPHGCSSDARPALSRRRRRCRDNPPFTLETGRGRSRRGGEAHEGAPDGPAARQRGSASARSPARGEGLRRRGGREVGGRWRWGPPAVWHELRSKRRGGRRWERRRRRWRWSAGPPRRCCDFGHAHRFRPPARLRTRHCPERVSCPAGRGVEVHGEGGGRLSVGGGRNERALDEPAARPHRYEGGPGHGQQFGQRSRG
mmetsp:Transcript_22063/g.50864  ORF Transcript_22063/g.50864 Transcript_22063/m.50864 type:complete len:207 (-) Transcript_22063:313-933(-)